MTTADYQWFDLKKYDRLKRPEESAEDDRQKAADAGFVGLWAQVLLDRVELQRFWNNAQQDDATSAVTRDWVREQFEMLKQNPLQSLGFQRSRRQAHTAEQPGIQMLTREHLASLYDSMARNNEDREEASSPVVVDAAWEQDDPWQRYAHLTIDLHATDKVLEESFKKWLKAWRAVVRPGALRSGELAAKCVLWGRRFVVPYFDMNFDAELNGKRVPREVHRAKLKLVGWEISGEQLDQLQKDIPRLVSSSNVDILLSTISTPLLPESV